MEHEKSRSMVAAAKPHFISPLIPGFEHQLSIPLAFLKYLDEGAVVGGDAVLRSPGGKLYPVKVSGREFKDEAWKQFVADHDLHVGDFLVFRYNARKVFDVMVFDPSTCERAYPPSLSARASAKRNHNVLPLAVYDEEPHAGRDRYDSRPADGDDVHVNSTTKEEAALTVRETPSCVITIKRVNLTRDRLSIPSAFARKNDLESMNHRSATILNEEGRSWPVNIVTYYKKDTHYQYSPGVAFGRGIRRFLEENGLKLGDTFDLELVQGGDIPAFRMSGLHANPAAVKQEIQKERRKKMKWESQNESGFLIKITRRYLYSLNLPLHFSERIGPTGVARTLILRNENGGSSYGVVVKSMKDGRACTGSGWRELIKANGIRAGNVLKFELVETGTDLVMTFKVASKEGTLPERTDADEIMN